MNYNHVEMERRVLKFLNCRDPQHEYKKLINSFTYKPTSFLVYDVYHSYGRLIKQPGFNLKLLLMIGKDFLRYVADVPLDSNKEFYQARTHPLFNGLLKQYDPQDVLFMLDNIYIDFRYYELNKTFLLSNYKSPDCYSYVDAVTKTLMNQFIWYFCKVEVKKDSLSSDIHSNRIDEQFLDNFNFGDNLYDVLFRHIFINRRGFGY